MQSFKFIIQAAFIFTSLSVGGMAMAADKSKAPDPTPEARKQMAEVHQKMADCLKSEKPFSECRKEMMAACKDMKGKDGHCPMMGEGKMHHHHDDKESD